MRFLVILATSVALADAAKSGSMPTLLPTIPLSHRVWMNRADPPSVRAEHLATHMALWEKVVSAPASARPLPSIEWVLRSSGNPSAPKSLLAHQSSCICWQAMLHGSHSEDPDYGWYWHRTNPAAAAAARA